MGVQVGVLVAWSLMSAKIILGSSRKTIVSSIAFEDPRDPSFTLGLVPRSSTTVDDRDLSLPIYYRHEKLSLSFGISSSHRDRTSPHTSKMINKIDRKH